jgi:predicted amidophosphoribosyltransferase
MRWLKNDNYIPVTNPPVLMSVYISNLIKKRMSNLSFSYFFADNPMLVPVPKSSLMKPETLWVPQRLAKALVQKGFGIAVQECLKRVKPLPKSATSLARERPKALDHYNSVEIEQVFPEPKEILLVDDVVTRGATFLGTANKLKTVFPRSRIRAFAAMRTISSSGDLKDIVDPCLGNISLQGQETNRWP